MSDIERLSNYIAPRPHTQTEICDQMAIIDHGKIVAHDMPYNLKKLHTSSTTRIRMSDPAPLLRYCSEHALNAVGEDGACPSHLLTLAP
jgi:ABC-type multidrug transport system ATPase subunit